MTEWISVKDKIPNIGQKVILCLKGVVQEEIYAFDQSDSASGMSFLSYWSRDDIDECPIMLQSDLWMPLPEPPK